MSTTNTITMNTSDLHGMALDWAVAQCEGAGHWAKPEKFVDFYSKPSFCKFTRDWSLAGEIIERERIGITDQGGDSWLGVCGWKEYFGQTMLEAAMRAFVAFKLGDTVEVPAAVFESMEVTN